MPSAAVQMLGEERRKGGNQVGRPPILEYRFVHPKRLPVRLQQVEQIRYRNLGPNQYADIGCHDRADVRRSLEPPALGGVTGLDGQFVAAEVAQRLRLGEGQMDISLLVLLEDHNRWVNLHRHPCWPVR